MCTDRYYLGVQVNEDERREMHTEFWLGDLIEEDDRENLGIVGV
jgi:hypothetical protein